MSPGPSWASATVTVRRKAGFEEQGAHLALDLVVVQPQQETCWFSAKAQRPTPQCWKSFLCPLINPNPIWSVNQKKREREYSASRTVAYITQVEINSFYNWPGFSSILCTDAPQEICPEGQRPCLDVRARGEERGETELMFS